MAVDKPQDHSPSAVRRQVLQITGSVLLARAIGIVAELEIADLVDGSPRTADELAVETGAHAPSLYRLLRYLASHEFFSEDEYKRFHLTPKAAVLRKDVPGSLYNVVRLGWQDVTWDSYRALPETIMTGVPAFTKAYGADFFDYLSDNPEINERFDASMALFSEPENSVIAQAYDFADASQVVDIGGGHGGLLSAILEAHANVTGILFDQEQVLKGAKITDTNGAKDRCGFVSGNFFEHVPPGGDVYLLKRILHDWDDDNARRILQNCAAALGESGRLLIIDAVIKPGNAPDPNKGMDVGIMALLAGRERTETEFSNLFQTAGLRLTRIVPTPAPSTLSIVEGIRST